MNDFGAKTGLKTSVFASKMRCYVSSCDFAPFEYRYQSGLFSLLRMALSGAELVCCCQQLRDVPLPTIKPKGLGNLTNTQVSHLEEPSREFVVRVVQRVLIPG